MKKLLLVAFALTFLTSTLSLAKDKAPKETKMSGWVSDEKCGAKDIDNADCGAHRHMLGDDPAAD